MMRIAQFRQYDIANGYGVRASLFVSGCSHRCKGCFNEEYQSFDYGKSWSQEMGNTILSSLSKPYIQGLTILGGEPMDSVPELTTALQKIQKTLKSQNITKDYWIYSGYTYEEIIAKKERYDLLKLCDVLVDGLFVENLKDPRLSFRGSSNQRIIDVQQSLKEEKIVEMKI